MGRQTDNQMDKQVSGRNYNWDFWKFIAAVGVILVHAPYKGNLGSILSSLGVLGVSFFYLISGYACHGEPEKMCPKIRKRLLRNGIITVLAVAWALAFSYYAMSLEHTEILWKMALKKPITYVRMILLGDFEFFYGSHLWFMVALLYCYVIFYILVRFRLKKVIYVLTPIFLLARIVVETYVNSYSGVSWHWSANALIGGLPMMLLGYVIADKKEKLVKIPTWILILGIVLSAGAVFAAMCFKVGKFNVFQPFNILCSSLVLILGAKKPHWSVIRPLSYLGRKDSLYIYLFHFYIIMVMYEVMNGMRLSSKVIEWQLPLAVIIVSVVVARFFSMLVDLVKLPFKLKKKKAAADQSAEA